MFLLYGPNTNGGTGSVIFTIEAGMRHVIAALSELARNGASTIEVRRDAPAAFDQELRAALRNTVWHTGCTSWYVDDRGNDPNQWPWLWSTYRRRTARISAGAYQLGSNQLTTDRDQEGSRHGATTRRGRDQRSSQVVPIPQPQ